MDQPIESPVRWYLILDRTDAERPVWQVVRVVATASANLNETGNYSAEEWSDVVWFATITLGRVLSFPYVPSPRVYRIREMGDR